MVKEEQLNISMIALRVSPLFERAFIDKLPTFFIQSKILQIVKVTPNQYHATIGR